MLDVVVKNGVICDGSGQPRFRGDIGINGKAIAKIGNIDEEAEKVINAEGLIVAPGFIDFHTHSDLALLSDPTAIPKITQGVTTEIIGHCGISAFPFNEKTYEMSKRYSSSVLAFKNMECDWEDLNGYFSRISEKGIAVNLGALVGHGSIRIAVMGFEDRKATPEEMEQMKQLLRNAFQQGAFGMSTGLAYVPGCYADVDELIELTLVVAECGGIYTTHLKNQSTDLVECAAEAIEIGRRTGAPIQLSHLKAVGDECQKNAQKVLNMMEKASKEGVDVTADQYPYIAGSSTLTAILPPWSLEGGMDKMLERLQLPEYRTKIKEDLKNGLEDWENRVDLLGWSKIYVSSVTKEENRYMEGKSIQEIADILGKAPEEALFDLLIDEKGNVGQIDYTSSEEMMKKIMQNPSVMFGSDGIYADEGKVHPRLYSTFPRILGKYVREEETLTLEEAVRKMTGLSAARLGIRDRGVIKEGMAADITVFNPDTIRDTATFDEPFTVAEGIEYVLVNGKLVLEKGEITGVTSGEVLRHSEVKNDGK